MVLDSFAQRVLGTRLPVGIRSWDGSTAGPEEGPRLVLHDRDALRFVLWRPGDLGLARAWVAGVLSVEGDLYELLSRISSALWEKEEQRSALQGLRRLLKLATRPGITREALGVVALVGTPLPPVIPVEEVRRRRGPAHTLRRDKRAISHHYDVGNDFYALVLGPSLVYSCAYWDKGPSAGGSLEQAQEAKLDLVCRKLDLQEGQRLLDVGCGWGSLAIHAARHYGVRVVGVTISEEQAASARQRVTAEGLGHLVEIRVQDYREIEDPPFDAISSIGMAEHVGKERYRSYADILYGLLKPGGRLLNHQIARRPLRDEGSYRMNAFIDRYVFPDGELAPVGSTVSALEESGFEVRDVESLREHYALTLRSWVTNLEEHWDEAVRLATPGRARVWRLYMAASAVAFESNTMGVNQVLAVRALDTGRSEMPLRRDFLIPGQRRG